MEIVVLIVLATILFVLSLFFAGESIVMATLFVVAGVAVTVAAIGIGGIHRETSCTNRHGAVIKQGHDFNDHGVRVQVRGDGFACVTVTP